MLEYSQIVTWVFYAMATVIGGGVLNILRKLTSSVEELNIKMAVLIEKTAYHEKELEKHDNRIGALENRGGNQ